MLDVTLCGLVVNVLEKPVCQFAEMICRCLVEPCETLGCLHIAFFTSIRL